MSKSPVIRLSVIVALVGVLGWMSTETHALQSERGSITGMVQTEDGKPAVGLNIKLVKDMPMTVGRPGRGGKGKSSGFDTGAVELQAKPGPRTRVVAQTTTDAQGKFTFNNVEAGGYRLEGGNKNIGWIYYDVLVEANKTTEVNDIKLTKLD